MLEFILHKPASSHHTHPMNAIRIVTPALIAGALFSCAPQKADNYDTPRPGATPTVAQATQPATPPANPVYDTPPAYEESPATTSAAGVPGSAARPGVARPAAAMPAVPAAPSTTGAATLHVVVAGDTLGKISHQYKVPIASIKQANHMTNDIVVLGRKMVIPPK